jgi:hypothetical protein
MADDGKHGGMAPAWNRQSMSKHATEHQKVQHTTYDSMKEQTSWGRTWTTAAQHDTLQRRFVAFDMVARARRNSAGRGH